MCPSHQGTQALLRQVLAGFPSMQPDPLAHPYALARWRASEQERKDVQADRVAWKESQPALDATKLVFLDETGTSTNMTRTRGRSPKGQRCIASVPHGHRKITTFIAGLRVNAVTAPMVL